MLYDIGIADIQRQISEQLQLQQKISAGRRVMKPSDDPIAAAAAIGIDQAKGLNMQYAANAAAANTALTLEEQALGDATRVLQDVKILALNAGSPVLKNEDRMSLAAQARGLYEELLGIANRTDGEGQYLFSGYRGSTKPFSESSPGVVSYAGDEGQRLLQIAPQRRIAAGDNGAEVFQRIRAGNGTFTATAGTLNSGTAVTTAGSVKDANAWANAGNSRDYTVIFDVSATTPAVTTYDIIDNATNLSMLTGLAPAAGPHARTYVPGTAISFRREAGDPDLTAWDAGVEIEITGAPATGDTFTVERSAMQDVFATIHQLIDTLNTGISLIPSSRAVYQNKLNATGASLDRALDQILTTRASTGSRMVEIETLKQTTEALVMRQEEERSRLVDLDFAQALSDVTRKQIALEAAHKSFLAITSLRLFDLL
jgi:flagellar hook-associated protein 3 FlgL